MAPTTSFSRFGGVLIFNRRFYEGLRRMDISKNLARGFSKNLRLPFDGL